MKTIAVPTKDQVDAKSQAIFDVLKSNLGMVPNLYATIGYSSNALSSFLEFSNTSGDTNFSKKEIEAIKLAVSEQNGCEYCIAAHTALAKMNGFTEEETLAIRRGGLADQKINTLIKLSQEIAKDAGRASDASKEAFFDLGYKEADLIDLVSIIISVTFTNYVFGATQVPVDFPKAAALNDLAAA